MDIIDRIVTLDNNRREKKRVDSEIRRINSELKVQKDELQKLDKLVKRVKLAPRFEVSLGLLQVASDMMVLNDLKIKFAVPYDSFVVHESRSGDYYVEKVGFDRYKVYYKEISGFIQFKNMLLNEFVAENGSRDNFLVASRVILSFLHLLQLNPGFDKLSPMAANKYRQEFGIEARGDIYKVLKITPFKDVSYGVNGEPLQRGPVREHDVRGHIRRYKNGKEVFIRSHVRGDALIGRVVKDYRVC